MIESDVRDGSMIILQRFDSAEVFYLYFMQCHRDGDCRDAEVTEIGLYDDLDTAVTIACIGCGAYDSNWKPVDEVRSSSLSEFIH